MNFKPGRLLRTLCHLRADQLVARVGGRLYRATWKARRPVNWESLAPEDIRLLPPGDPSITREIRQWRLNHWGEGWNPDNPGRFTFLNDTHDIGFPPPWDGPPSGTRDPALWHFHLHYWDWIWTPGSDIPPPMLLDAFSDWLDNCPLGTSSGFRGPASPYTTSRRLPNWLLLWDELGKGGDDKRLIRLEKGILGQAAWLAGHLEWEHRGNHLLENLYALAFLGFFLPGKNPFINWDTMADQLEEQILPDGLHGEGSAMYHCLVLDRLLDLLSMEMMADKPVLPGKIKSLIEDKCSAMAGFLHHILPSDGFLPRLADTAEGMTPPGSNILERAQSILRRKPKSRTSTGSLDGHWVWRSPKCDDFLLFDAAPGGLGYCGAHQHADLLHFHLYLRGRRTVTSGGAGIYREGKARDRSRSSHEHATVVMDGVQCCEPWKSFRLGHRGKVRLQDQGSEGGVEWVVASHNGFRELGARHERLVTVETDTSIVTIRDRILATSHKKPDQKIHTIDLFLPIGPGIQAGLTRGGVQLFEWESQQELARVFVAASVKGQLAFHKGRYYHSFGAWESRVVLQWRFFLPLDEEIRMTIQPSNPMGTP